MPATEETYRPQTTLHVVFAVTSIVMLLSMVWMILADHLRPWKEVQREFHHIEEAKLKATEEQKRVDLEAKHKNEIEELDRKIAAAREKAKENARLIREKEMERDKLTGEFDRLDTLKRFKKAELL
jgi:biopolymer transport protein ExbB/TolQ